VNKELYCNLGWSLGAADVNDDGFDDLIVGAPFAPSADGQQTGMVALLFASSHLRGLTSLSACRSIDQKYVIFN